VHLILFVHFCEPVRPLLSIAILFVHFCELAELPRSRYGGSTKNFPAYGRLKDSARAWKPVTSGQ
jgi:hypothetical protein